MRLLPLCLLVACILHLHAAAEPYVKSSVPWAVYLPDDATDTKGDADANAFLKGNDTDGWYTFLVFKADGTHITNNSDLYTAGVPEINQEDDYDGETTKEPDFIITKFVLIQPATTPTSGADSSSYVDMGSKLLTLGHEETALGYNANEKKVTGVTIANDYWMAARETPKKLWRITLGDKLSVASPGPLSTDLISFLTGNANDNQTLNNLGPVIDLSRFASLNMTDYTIRHDFPMFALNWEDCREFCSRLAIKMGSTNRVRIPNEYEWEYAARAGETAELPTGLYEDNKRSWKIIDASDTTEKALPISTVFGKTYHPTDIPHRLVSETSELVTVGTNPDGSPIRESRITTIKWVIDPRLETLMDWKIVVGGDTGPGSINYDKRYPSNMSPLPTRNFELHSNGTAFVSVNVTNIVDGGNFTGGKDISPSPAKNEYYHDEYALARAVNSYYIGVMEDGSYAARQADPTPIAPAAADTRYVYDPALVHHFERMTGESIWPPNHPSAGPMNAGNTILTYLHWHSYDGAAEFPGGFFIPAPQFDQAIAELKSAVRSEKFANTPGGYHEKNYKGDNKVYIADKTSIKDDYNLKGKSDKNSMLMNIIPEDAHRNDKNHAWYYFNGWNSHGQLKSESEEAGNGLVFPIDGFDARYKGKKVTPGANPWGMESILGNAAELCMPAGETDWASRWDGLSTYEFYSSTGNYVVARGGSWNSSVTGIRFANRKPVHENNRSHEIGFRILIEQ